MLRWDILWPECVFTVGTEPEYSAAVRMHNPCKAKVVCEYWSALSVYCSCKGEDVRGCLHVCSMYCNHVNEVQFALPGLLHERLAYKSVWMSAFSQRHGKSLWEEVIFTFCFTLFSSLALSFSEQLKLIQICLWCIVHFTSSPQCSLSV